MKQTMAEGGRRRSAVNVTVFQREIRTVKSDLAASICRFVCGLRQQTILTNVQKKQGLEIKATRICLSNG